MFYPKSQTLRPRLRRARVELIGNHDDDNERDRIVGAARPRRRPLRPPASHVNEQTLEKGIRHTRS